MSSKGTTTTGTFEPPPEFMNAYKESLNMAKAAVNTPYQQYPGNLVAGLTPTQQAGIANVNAAQGLALPAIQTGMGYTQQAARGITPELYNQYYSPYVKDVANATMANLMESQAQQQSNLKSGAIQSGAFGGDRGGVAQSELARQQQLANAQAMSGIYNQGYGQAMGLAGQQVTNLGAMGAQMANMGNLAQGSVLQGAQAQMAAGAQEQATEQARLQAAHDQWLQLMAQPYQNAQFYGNIAMGLGAGAGGTSTTTAPGPDIFSQILGGVGAIGSIYSGSDKRMKENIEPVGKLKDGQTVYRFNYKGDPKTQIGLIAQEVEGRHPEAVAKDRRGLRFVDYKEATDDAAQMASAGGVVSPSMMRNLMADGGGLPFYPYGQAEGYIPEGKLEGRRNTIPEAPKPYEDKGLAEDWQKIMPITSDQASGLNKLATDLGILEEKVKNASEPSSSEGFSATKMPKIEDAPITASKSILDYVFPYARGGVVGRHGYDDGGTAEYPELIQSESGGDFGAENEQGYVGRAQFGPARLIDIKRAGVIPADMTPEQLRLDKNAQMAAEKWHFADINNSIDQSGLGKLEGKTIKGIPITREGLVNVAHLGGKTGLQKFVASGGRYNPADVNGTRLSDYLAMAADNGGVASSDVVPAAETRSGVAAATEEPSSRFSMKKLFANDENPSLIERVMGRRLSPEARNAIMNASFALMAGRSPWFFTNLGEAGKVGTQTYYNALAQKTGMAEKQAGILKTQAETAAAQQEMRRKVLSLYYMSKTAFEQNPNATGSYMPFEEWAQKNGFPQFVTQPSMIGGDKATVAPATPVSDYSTPSPSPGGVVETIERKYMPPPAGAEEASTAKEASESPEPNKPYTVQPEGSPTILADPTSGPSPKNPNTLPYWTDKIDRLTKSRASADFVSPEYAQSIDKQIETARQFVNDIRSSDDYKNSVNFNSQYARTKAGLEKLAKINAEYEGGRLANPKAEVIGTLQAMGLGSYIPAEWANETANFDSVTKGALDLALRNAAQLGALAQAPGRLMELEGKVTPMADLSPAARYDIVRRALADLEYGRDLYATWDQGLNFAQHQADFRSKNPYDNYLAYATDKLPKPVLPKNVSVPGETPKLQLIPAPKETQDMLNNMQPNAPEGSSFTNKKSKITYIKKNGQWVQSNGQ